MIGKTISHYTILDKLGEGGMGIVYKAHDKKLDRIVALKFLSPHLDASDQDKARFVQEAKAAASLNHPNVCSIIDIQDLDGQMFIVMEFVDGQTLRARKGNISFKQGLEIGIQIAEGLAAAHEKGIVHRDIKPENIMVRKDGIVQVMDFGLAKLRASGSAITRLTKEGSTVGTAGYMSPEQILGQDTDHRSDIFSYGVLLYELLTCQLPFKGVHETAIAYEIVNVDPAPMTSINPDIDPGLDAIVLECLEKDVNERTQSIKQIAIDLRRVKRESTRQRATRITAARPAYVPSASSAVMPPGPADVLTPPPSPASGSKLSRMLPWALAAAGFLVALAMAGFHYLDVPLPPPRQVTRATLLPPPRVNINVQVGGHLAISPDGQRVAFVGTDTLGTDLVWIRNVAALVATPMAGTNGATYPFWSPDGKTIGFFADGKLKKVESNGGPVLTLCDAPEGRGGTWNREGTIVFAGSANSGLSKVAAAGGSPVPVTKLDSAGITRNHRWPHFLPDGKHFLFSTQSTQGGTNDNDVIRVAAVDGTIDTVLTHGNSNVEYASGYLLFHRQSMLMAQPFDPERCAFTGDAVPIAEQLQYNDARSRAMFSASQQGTLIYQGGEEQEGKLALYDLRGERTETYGMKYPRGGKFSHDNSRITYMYLDNQSRQSDIWVYEVGGGRSSRLTFDLGLENTPYFSPSDDSIAYSSNRAGRFDLYIKSADGTGADALLFKSDLDKYIHDWSLDGRYITFTSFGSQTTKADMWLLPLTGDRTPISFLQTEFREGIGCFSPDGRWIAYQSDESGRFEIYVRAVDRSPGKWQISVNGGANARWSRDGKWIIFQSIDRKAMAAAVRVTGTAVMVDDVRQLFDFEPRGIFGSLADISRDGRHLLAQMTENRQASPPITLVMNWDEELRKQ